MIASLKVLDHELSFQPIWSPGASSSVQPRRLVNRFGDGSKQIVRDGINDKPRKMTLALDVLNHQELQEVEDFLDANSIHFLMRPPKDESDPDGFHDRLIRVECSRWTPRYQRGGTTTLSMEIEQRF